MKNTYLAILVVVSAVIGLLRFTVPGHELSYAGSYEAIAHIWVGVLLTTILSPTFKKGTRWLAGISLGIITVLEAIMFLVR